MVIEQFFNKEACLSLVFRVVPAILFFFQGYDKVFRIKMPGVLDTFRREMQEVKLPSPVISMAAYFTSYVELIGGALLLLGLAKGVVVWFLGIDLILVTAAFSMMNPAWNMQMVLPRLLLMGVVMYLPDSWDVWSLDYWLRPH